MGVVTIDTRRITDWETFHDVFADAFGFPEFYGRNMDAWNDCMASLDDPSAGMTRVFAPLGGVVVLHLEHVEEFCDRRPDLYTAILDGAAFVNWRRGDLGLPAVLALSYYR